MLLHNANPRPRNRSGIIFQVPSCMDMSISKGTDIKLTGPGDDHESPARVPNIQKIRLIAARASYRRPKVDINLCDWERGALAARKGLGLDPLESEEWIDGFNSYEGDL